MRVYSLVILLCLLRVGCGSVTPPHTAIRTDVEKGSSARTECDSRKRRKSTLKVIKETPFTGLFYNLKNQTVFEASGIEIVDGLFYSIFDSSMSIGVLDEGFHFRSKDNKLIGEKGEVDSDFEGIAYVPENKTFLLLQEAIEHGDHYHPHILHVKVHDDMENYDIIQECIFEFELSHSNKGFEDIQYVKNDKGAYLMGLCEGNHCVGGSVGKDAGNGRIVLAQLVQNGDGSCEWRPERVLKVPRSAYFTDYSDMAFHGSKLAILSQEDAALWIGDFNKERMEFESCGQVFHFPRDNHCEVVYCNLEGIQFIDDRRVVVTSDKAKRYQPYYCDAKDQTVHIFSLPITYDPYAQPPKGQAIEECNPVDAA